MKSFLLFAVMAHVLAAQAVQVEGKVLDAATGAPIAGVRVALDPLTGAAARVTVTTGENGGFVLKEIAAGTYKLFAGGNGLPLTEFGATAPYAPGTPLLLIPGQVVKGIEIKLAPLGSISGRILDEDRKPVPAAEVRALRALYLTGQRQLAMMSGAKSNERGEYKIDELPVGPYYISAALRQPAAERAEAETYVASYHPRGADPLLAELVELSGGGRVEQIDVVLAKMRTVRVRGRVIDRSGIPSPGRIMVFLRSAENEMSTLPSAQASGPENRFEFRDVKPGRSALMALVGEGDRRCIGRLEVEAAADIDDARLIIGPGFEVRGEVLVEEERKVAFDRLQVHLTQNGVDGLAFGPQPGGKIGEDGRFVFPHVNPGHYGFYLSGLPDGFYIKSVYADTREGLEDAIDLTSGSPVLLHVVISGRAGTLQGTVTTDRDKPAPGTVIVLVPESSKRRERLRFYGQTSADQYGRFRMKSVEPGDYRMFAWERIEERAWMDPAVMGAMQSAGTKVRVLPSENRTVELKVIPAK